MLERTILNWLVMEGDLCVIKPYRESHGTDRVCAVSSHFVQQCARVYLVIKCVHMDTDPIKWGCRVLPHEKLSKSTLPYLIELSKYRLLFCVS